MLGKKKKIIIISCAATAALAIAAGAFFILKRPSKSSGENVVYTSSVGILTGTDTGAASRFSGVIEPQKTVKVQKATDRTVKEVFVKEGDNVKKGDNLFSYDTDEIQLKLSEAELELERLTNDISTLYEQIDYLEKEKEKAPESEAFSYTTQILTAQNDAKRAEYNKKSKGVEIEQIKKNLENSTITSEIDGIIKSVNDGSNVNTYNGGSGDDNAFITILSSNSYRIKGKINEQNMSVLTVGQKMIVHSRINEDLTWHGTITEIDVDNPVSNSSNAYYGGSADASAQSSSYYFYMELENGSDLMLGQHVFMEPDYGQTEVKSGLWLSGAFVVTEGNDAYVWAANKKNKLEKRQITTGEYDENLDEYEILDGLTTDDYIAFPDASYKEGMPCSKNEDGGMGGMPVPGGDMGEPSVDGAEDGAVEPGVEGADENSVTQSSAGEVVQ